MEYITEPDVTALLGTGWAGDGDAALAVQQANDWLDSRNIPLLDPMPDRIIRAGAQLARLAAAGTLYADSDGDVKRESVQAGEVSIETEYADGSKVTLGAMAYVNDLLSKWLRPYGSVQMLRRL